MKKRIRQGAVVALTYPEYYAVRFVGVILLITVSLYVYFVVHIIGNVVARKSFEYNTKVVASAISELQSTYERKAQSLTHDEIAMRGFVNAKNTTFASQSQNSVVGFLHE